MKSRSLVASKLSLGHYSNGIRVGVVALVCGVRILNGAALSVPNYSFESPVVPPVAPYAGPAMDDWQKSAQPVWYDPHQNQDTPWEYLMGQFVNVPFPGQFIDNCDGAQAAFLFAVPEVALFQDYNSISGTNTIPTHAFNAKFAVGRSYDLTVGLIGGGGAMKPGVTLLLDLYYRDASSNKVVVASTTVTNTTANFPTNTHFVDFSVHVPTVKQADAWAGKNIGIELLSTVGFDIPGGYWDLDNVRLSESGPTLTVSGSGFTNGHFRFTLLSDPGLKFEIQATTNLTAGPAGWITVGTLTNVTGSASFTDSTTNLNRRHYRARQL